MQGIERAPLERLPRRGHGDDSEPSLLYPLMLIAAIAVIVFSIVGIASLMGVMPRALSDNPGVAPRSAPTTQSGSAPAAGETRSGVIQSIRPVQTKVQPSGLRAIGGAPVNSAPSGAAGVRTTLHAGHEIGNQQQVTYRVRIRMDDGRLHTFYETAQPVYGVGHTVRVTGRTILAAG